MHDRRPFLASLYCYSAQHPHPEQPYRGRHCGTSLSVKTWFSGKLITTSQSPQAEEMVTEISGKELPFLEEGK